MKKRILTAAAALFLCACTSSAGGVSGTFSGEAEGMGGSEKPVKVTITLENSKITKVIAEGEGETDGIGTKALEEMPGKIVSANSLNVDVVSGATITSNAILDAAEQALSEAGLKPSDLAK